MTFQCVNMRLAEFDSGFQLAFDYVLTGCTAVSFPVCHALTESQVVTMQVAIQFLFQLTFDHAFTDCFTGSFSVFSLTRLHYSFFCHITV